jgi:hypothetical protein
MGRLIEPYPNTGARASGWRVVDSYPAARATACQCCKCCRGIHPGDVVYEVQTPDALVVVCTECLRWPA